MYPEGFDIWEKNWGRQSRRSVSFRDVQSYRGSWSFSVTYLYINCMSWYTILILCLYKAFTLACDNGCDYLTPFLSLNKWSPVTCFYGFMWKLHFDSEGQLFFVFQQVKETWTCCHVVAMSLVKRNYQLWVNYNILYTVYIWITVSVYCTMYCTYTVVFCKIRSNLVCLSHREVPDSNPGV